MAVSRSSTAEAARAASGKSAEREHTSQVFDVLLAQSDGTIVVACVVIPLRESEPSLVQIQQIDARVVEIRYHGRREPGSRSDLVQVGKQRKEIADRVDLSDPVEEGTDRIESGIGDRRLVHSEGEIPPDDVGRATGWSAIGGGAFEQTVEETLVTGSDLFERCPSCVLGWHRVGRDPSAVHVTIEIVTGIDRRIRVARVEDGIIGPNEHQVRRRLVRRGVPRHPR